MRSITAKPFDPDMQNLLSEIDNGYHAVELSKKDKSELPAEIYLIEEEAELVGYAVIWEYKNGKLLIDKAEKDYFDKEDKYLEKDFYIDIKNKTDIILIEVLDILRPFEGKGYAKFFMNYLKEKYPKKKMYVYTIHKSRNFWFKQDFAVLGTTNWVTFN
ncbi:GCN5 family acetyltransferase [Paenibacillus psychroresistens]|uniref:GCN5 family acetyltransferase n=1 Tax=Paenibacillus psychroresistens TaxID=1778678 RepID=A0A6B8RFT3_9BACL|nr:GCN5 family acetyltransferase [Paenibacillus psychroresistens]QGQ94226.1 GCN5 family acetyltransferase [Paenibacillus psychroresistens]